MYYPAFGLNSKFHQGSNNMSFRKEALLFCQTNIVCGIIAILFLFLSPILGWLLSWTCFILFIILILINPLFFSEYIIIDEKGISCKQASKLLWEYGWENISELKYSSRYRMPSVEILTKNKSKEYEQIVSAHSYFQLCRTAKKAIDQYYQHAKHQ